MRVLFFALLMCISFLSTNSASAQLPSPLDFKFNVHINGVDYGPYDLATSYTGVLQKVNASQPDLPFLCPGDQITLKNECRYNNTFHSFSGSGNPFQTPTIGLTPTTGVSNPNNNYFIPIIHLADVCSACSYQSPSPYYHSPNNWNVNTDITVTYYDAPSNYTYLAIDAGGTTNVIGDWGCGHRVAYLPLNIGDKPTKINDLSICPGDLVHLNLDPNCSYSNWVPNNPNLSSLSTTTSYTVDITNNSTNGCTLNDPFTIHVSNPDTDLSIVDQLCYGDVAQITEDDFFELYSNNTTPSQIIVDGVLIADGNTVMDLPHVISSQYYSPGTVTIEYIYMNNGLTCVKKYEVIIHPEIVLNSQSNYEFCNGNFQAICATSNGLPQSGVTYRWRKFGSSAAPIMSTCFTPTSYGTYYVTAFRPGQLNCAKQHYITVSDPGVGIEKPDDISFCSMSQPNPSYIGWYLSPFRDPHNFLWTYTDENGNTTSANTSTPSNTYYQGPGTYTVVITAPNGCTETFNILVTDIAQTYTNHMNASFSFTPLSGNWVSCQPTTNIAAADTWIVTNLSTNTPVSTVSYGAGIRFSYTVGVQYSVTLSRKQFLTCKTFINQFTWFDDPFKFVMKDGNASAGNFNLNLKPTTINTFPNPTTGLVHIQLKEAETTETNIRVLNTLGQVVLEKKVEESTNIEIDLSKEENGLYILHIINGDSQFTEKIIKE